MLVSSTNEQQLVPAQSNLTTIDTTAAGDSFNAGYLAARIKGFEPKTAATFGHKLASIVISHRGAIIPTDSMPHFW